MKVFGLFLPSYGAQKEAPGKLSVPKCTDAILNKDSTENMRIVIRS